MHHKLFHEPSYYLRIIAGWTLSSRKLAIPPLLRNIEYFLYKSQKFSNFAHPGESLGLFLITVLYLCAGLGKILPCIPKRSHFSSPIIVHTQVLLGSSAINLWPGCRCDSWKFGILLRYRVIKMFGTWQNIYQSPPPEIPSNYCMLELLFFLLWENRILTPEKFTQNWAFEFLLCSHVCHISPSLVWFYKLLL